MEKEPDRTLNLEAIAPPRLEDAGLEDCALPFESILEAFSKAASISRFSDSLDDASDSDSEEGDGGSKGDQIEDGREPTPVRDVIKEERSSTGGDTVVVRTGEDGKAEADEKK